MSEEPFAWSCCVCWMALCPLVSICGMGHWIRCSQRAWVGLFCDKGHLDRSEDLGDEVGKVAGAHLHGLRYQVSGFELAIEEPLPSWSWHSSLCLPCFPEIPYHPLGASVLPQIVPEPRSLPDSALRAPQCL